MQRRALIVDDEPATCQMIEKALGSVGIESLVLTKSTEAAGVLRQGKFEVVFLDFRMAFPDGAELTRQMRESGFNRTTPVVMISDDQRPDALSRAFEAGASFFLYKPIDKDRLLRLIRATQGAIEHERRRTRRVPLRSKVQLRFGGQEIEGETVNVSMEGVLVEASRAVAIGSSVDVCLHLSKEMKPVVGAGCVVRLSGANQMGIHLGRLVPEESERLQEFLLSLVGFRPSGADGCAKPAGTKRDDACGTAQARTALEVRRLRVKILATTRRWSCRRLARRRCGGRPVRG
jgi:CheY-like chemotaxis protein